MDFTTWRSLMPVTRKWAFFDHAAVAPLPEPTRSVLHAYADDQAAEGIAVIAEWVEKIKETRVLAGRLLNADPLDVAFVPSTSMGIGYVAEGFPFQSGDNVVSVGDEYPSNQYPWMNLRDRGVEFRAVPTDIGVVNLDRLFTACDSKTKVLTISSVEFSTGFRNDLAAIAEFCQKRGIFFFLDAIQSLGVIPLDVRKLPIDALAADGHKWLLGPEGAGLFYLRRDWVERFHTIGVGWHSVVNPLAFGTIDFRLKPHAGRWEGGTMNIAGVTAMGESIRLLLDLGVDHVEKRVLELTDRLCEGAVVKGWSIYGSRNGPHRSGIVSLTHPSLDPLAIQNRCRDAGIIVNVRAGRLRASPHGYNTEAEIDRFVEVL